ncbi:MAG: hypothetical protein V7K35_14370 [Nostoc sp.]
MTSKRDHCDKLAMLLKSNSASPRFSHFSRHRESMRDRRFLTCSPAGDRLKFKIFWYSLN